MDFDLPDYEIWVQVSAQEVWNIERLIALLRLENMEDLFNQSLRFGLVWANLREEGYDFFLVKQDLKRKLELGKPMLLPNVGNLVRLKILVKLSEFPYFETIKRIVGEPDEGLLMRRLLIGYKTCAFAFLDNWQPMFYKDGRAIVVPQSEIGSVH